MNMLARFSASALLEREPQDLLDLRRASAESFLLRRLEGEGAGGESGRSLGDRPGRGAAEVEQVLRLALEQGRAGEAGEHVHGTISLPPAQGARRRPRNGPGPL